jgi:hypothetical protein
MAILAAVPADRGPPEVVDVGACSTPPDDRPGCSGERPRAKLEPAILAIDAPQARFHARSMGLVDAEAGIGAPISIEEVDLPIRLRSPHQSRKRIDDGAEIVLHAGPFRDGRDDRTMRQSAGGRSMIRWCRCSVRPLPGAALSSDARLRDAGRQRRRAASTPAT